MSRERSIQMYATATRYMPGGVNSPARAWTAVGGDPLFISRAEGSRVWDADDNEYIDYVCSWGPMVLGHAHPEVVAAINAAVSRGTSFGAPTEVENRMAQKVVESFQSMDLVRFVSSGTEAGMTTLRALPGRSRGGTR